MNITVLGASGYTGKLVCELLEKNKLPFRMAVRKITELPTYFHCTSVYKVDVLNRDEVSILLDKTEILINCVGPYNVLGQIVINEVKKRPLYYLDLTGEQSFVKSSYEDHKNKACLIHSCAFESALVDLMAFKILNPSTHYSSINSFYHFASPIPSPGTRFTIKVHGFFDQFFIHNRQLQKNHLPFVKEKLDLPGINENEAALFAPFPEVIFFHKHFKVADSASFMIMDRTQALMASERSGPNARLEDVIAKNARMKVQGPSESERSQQHFSVYLQAIDLQGKMLTAELSGKDMYLVTAGLVVEGVKLLMNNRPAMGQVLSPAEAFSKDSLFENIIKDFELSFEVQD